MKRNFKEKLTDIRAFAFDVDGVFTNSLITITPDGQMIRQFNVKDGLAVVRAVEKKYPIAIISGGRGQQVEQRMKGLGIEHLYLNCQSKIEALYDFSSKVGVPISQMMYVGDDYPDIEPMRAVALSIAPSDAADAVRGIADYTSLFAGGAGVIRDAIEQVMRARADWFEIDESIKAH